MGLDVLYLLIPASVLLALVALALFVWAIHSGQFDDLETPALRILFDDPPVPSPDIEARTPNAEARPPRAVTPNRASE